MRCYKIGYTLLLVLIMVSCAFISLILKDSSPPLIKLVAEEECVYKSKIVFVKTHKTGGSTLQNILFRYGYLQDLVFALPPQGWMYSLDKGFEAEMAKGNEQPWSKYFSMDVFAFHSRFNIDELRKVISDPIVLTILRDPVETFESNYVYMGLSSRYNGSNINEFTQKYLKNENKRKNESFIGRNQLFWDLGFQNLNNLNSIDSAISQLDDIFDLVLILEKIDQSLILMMRKLCWSLDNITYLKHNIRISKSEMTFSTRKILREWLKYDYILYGHFSRKHDEYIRDYGVEKINKEVRLLREKNRELIKTCSVKLSSRIFTSTEFRPESDLVYGYYMNESMKNCMHYGRTEPSFVRLIRTKQLAKTFLHSYSHNLLNNSDAPSLYSKKYSWN